MKLCIWWTTLSKNSQCSDKERPLKEMLLGVKYDVLRCKASKLWKNPNYSKNLGHNNNHTSTGSREIIMIMYSHLDCCHGRWNVWRPLPGTVGHRRCHQGCQRTARPYVDDRDITLSSCPRIPALIDTPPLHAEKEGNDDKNSRSTSHVGYLVLLVNSQ